MNEAFIRDFFRMPRAKPDGGPDAMSDRERRMFPDESSLHDTEGAAFKRACERL